MNDPYDKDIQPMITLLGDLDAGEGSIKIEPAYKDGTSALFRADCLKDWIGLLEDEYNKQLGKFEDELELYHAPK